MKRLGRVTAGMLAFVCVLIAMPVDAMTFYTGDMIDADREQIVQREQHIETSVQEEATDSENLTERARVTTLTPNSGTSESSDFVQKVQQVINPGIIFKAAFGLQLLIIGVGLSLRLLGIVMKKQNGAKM